MVYMLSHTNQPIQEDSVNAGSLCDIYIYNIPRQYIYTGIYISVYIYRYIYIGKARVALTKHSWQCLYQITRSLQLCITQLSDSPVYLWGVVGVSLGMSLRFRPKSRLVWNLISADQSILLRPP